MYSDELVVSRVFALFASFYFVFEFKFPVDKAETKLILLVRVLRLGPTPACRTAHLGTYCNFFVSFNANMCIIQLTEGNKI